MASATSNPFSLGAVEVWRGFKRWRFWLTYGWRDAQATYVATVFGGLIISFQTALYIAVIDLVFRAATQAHHSDYLSYLALGLPLFTLIASSIAANQSVFQRNQAILKNIPFPVFAFVMRSYFRSLVHLGYALLPFACLLAFGLARIPYSGWTAIPGIALFFGISLVTTCFFSLFSLYFSNLSALLNATTRFLFIATPVMWIVGDTHGPRAILAHINPVYHVLTIVREPLLGHTAAPLSYIVASAWFILMAGACLFFLAHVRRYLVLKL